MRTLTYLVSLFFLFPVYSIPDDHPNTKGVITLINNGFAHACPCEGKVYTAGHVIKPPFSKEDLRAFTWEDGYGNKGRAEGKVQDDHRDLGLLEMKDSTPSVYYTRASTPPNKDDKVYWEEFGDNDFLPKVRDAKVMYTKAGYVFFDEQPKAGASGSCLFNKAGEVVGIVVWGFYKDGKRFGAATLLTDR